MKLQDDVTSQMMEIQRLKGRESSAPLQGQLLAMSCMLKASLDRLLSFRGSFQTEQLTELKQELIKKENQLREVKKNGTNLEKKLEYER